MNIGRLKWKHKSPVRHTRQLKPEVILNMAVELNTRNEFRLCNVPPIHREDIAFIGVYS
jgi:hypothetical protein